MTPTESKTPTRGKRTGTAATKAAETGKVSKRVVKKAGSTGATSAAPRTRKTSVRSATPSPSATASTSPETTSLPRPVYEPTRADIAARAYYLYLERRQNGGSEFDDWIRAERELRNGRPVG